MAADKTSILMTVPPEMVRRGIVNAVADSLDIDAVRVSVIRVTRKQGGVDVEAEVRITEE